MLRLARLFLLSRLISAIGMNLLKGVFTKSAVKYFNWSTFPFNYPPYLSHEHKSHENSLLTKVKDEHIYWVTVTLNHTLLTSAMSMKPLKGVSHWGKRQTCILRDCSFKSSTSYFINEHETPEGELFTKSAVKYCSTVPLNHPLLTSAMSMKPLKGVSSLSARTKTFTWLFFLLLLAATCKRRLFYFLVNLFCWSLYIKSVEILSSIQGSKKQLLS